MGQPSIFTCESLADYLRKVITSNGYSYAEISRQCDLRSTSHLNMIANGKRVPSLALLGKWRELFGMSDEEFTYAIGLLGREKCRTEGGRAFYQEKLRLIRSQAYVVRDREWMQTYLGDCLHGIIAAMAQDESFCENTEAIQKRLTFKREKPDIEAALSHCAIANLAGRQPIARLAAAESHQLQKEVSKQNLRYAQTYLSKRDHPPHFFRAFYATMNDALKPYLHVMIHGMMTNFAKTACAGKRSAVYGVGVQIAQMTQQQPRPLSAIERSHLTNWADKFDESQPVVDRPSVYSYRMFSRFFSDYMSYLRQDNPKYSYRWLARQIGDISPAQLNLVAQGERSATVRLVGSLSSPLRLSARETTYAQVLAGFNGAKDFHEKAYFSEKLAKFFNIEANHLTDEENRKFWFEPLHPLILEMASLRDFRADPAWIANRIAYPVEMSEIRKALNFLVSAGIFVEKGTGLVSNVPLLGTGGGLTQADKDQINARVVAKLLQAIELEQNQSNIYCQRFYLVDPDQVLEGTRRINEMIRDCLQLMETSEGSETYLAQIQVMRYAD